MAVEFRQYDEHGFPVAPRFADTKYQDGEPPAGPKFSPATKRLLFAGVLVGLVALIFGQQIVSAGHELVSRWFVSRAERKLQAHDFAGAMADLSTAIEWNPTNLNLLFVRATLRSEANDLPGSVADLSAVITLLKDESNPLAGRHNRVGSRNDWLVKAYAQRGLLLQRLGKPREAIDDATQAIKILPTANNYNSRAYARALANMELQEGLDDIDKALSKTGPLDPEYASFLDTRGYLLHLLDRNDEALRDLDRAITIAEKQKVNLQEQAFLRDEGQDDDKLKLDLAVMYHHRGLVHQKLDHADAAQNDLRRGDEMGYDPANGVL